MEAADVVCVTRAEYGQPVWSVPALGSMRVVCPAVPDDFDADDKAQAQANRLWEQPTKCCER